MTSKEGFYASIAKSFRPDVSLIATDERLSQREKDFRFAMRCNGYFLLENGEWKFDSDATKPFVEEFKGQRVSFFGPGPTDKFFSGEIVSPELFVPAFSRQWVIDVIGKYREVDEDQAARIAFLLGGIVRHLVFQTLLWPTDKMVKIPTAVEFAARMTVLGERRSGDAIASAMAMYIISGGSLEENKPFVGNIYNMAEAVRKDPIVPLKTKDLGLSQVARLQTFVGHRTPPDITEYEAAFDGFPTVGAEFHFSPDAPRKYPNFWQRLAILNMSQYQRGSYVQLSRNDRGVIEVRMNPSIYPTAIANWNHIRLLLPELNQTFFTVTINRPAENFSWKNEGDKILLNNLRALGMLSYAGIFEDVSLTVKQGEINFGQVYLGQTVKMRNGKYEFDGNWGGGEGEFGQLGIYAGFGDNFPYLAYYLSMALANPNILRSVRRDFLPKIRTLKDALALNPADRKGVFSAILNCVETDGRLSKASESGKRIVELLDP